MTATYTWDVFATVDGYGSYTSDGDWGAFWGTAGPEFLQHRAAQLAESQRLVLGANTFRLLQHFHARLTPADDATDPINTRLKHLPTTVVSTTLSEPLDWPDAEIRRGDASDVVRELKDASPVPLCSHGSQMLNRVLVAAGLVDRIQLTVFPALSGRTGDVPVFRGLDDLDLDLVSHQVLDGRILELTYVPSPHGHAVD